MINKEKINLIVLWIMMAVYIGVFCTAAAIRFFAFDFHDMDLAVYDQIIWNILHGRFYSSILGVNFLGHHADFLAFPLAIIYLFFQHPLTLLFVQTLALGMGAYPLYLLACRFLNNYWALFIALLYFIYPGLGRTNAYEFHFTSFATLSLLWAFYFFFEERYIAFSVSILLTLLCQENMPLVIFVFGLYALVQGRSPKWYLPFMVLAVFYFIFCIKFLFPLLNPNRIQFISIYSHFGHSYTEILKTLVIHPVYTWSYVFASQRIDWLLNLFSPLSFIAIMAPLHLLPAIPLFLQHLLSNRPQEINLYFHYTAELIPFVFVSFVFGIRTLMKFYYLKRWSFLLMIVVFWIALSAMMRVGSPLPFGQKLLKDESIAVKQKMVNLVSANSDLMTTFEFMSHLSHRSHLYSFHHIYWGHYTLSSLPYQWPDHVDEALINFNDGLTFGSFYDLKNYKNIQNMIQRYHLAPLAVRDNTVFFKANVIPTIELYHCSREIPVGLRGPLLFEYKGIALRAIKTIPKDDQIKMDMVWQIKKKISKDIQLYIDYFNDHGKLVKSVPGVICYRILPTQAWQEGQWIIDHKYLTIPVSLRHHPLEIRVGFYDQATRFILGKPVAIKIGAYAY